MSDPPGSDISVGELSRQVRDVLVRVEGVVKKLEDQFVPKRELELYKENFDLHVMHLRAEVSDLEKNKADAREIAQLKQEVEQLKSDKVWLVRVIGAFVIVAILTVVFTAGGGVAVK